jgi:hypothetical protein
MITRSILSRLFEHDRQSMITRPILSRLFEQESYSQLNNDSAVLSLITIPFGSIRGFA